MASTAIRTASAVRAASEKGESVRTGWPLWSAGRVLAASLALSVLSASAQQDLDCEDFTYQEDAQDVYNADPSDPHGLDGPKGPDNDTRGTPGLACENLPPRPAESVPTAELAPTAELGPTAEPAPNEERAPRQRRNQTEETPEPERPRNRQREETPVPAPTPEPVIAVTPVGAEPRVVTAVDIDCVDLEYQEVAQAVLARDPSDPFNLDPSGDGFACTSLPSRVVVTHLPSTGTGTMAWELRPQVRGS